MPKATTKTEATTEADATPIVPASVAAAVKAYISSDVAVTAAATARENKWMACAKVLANEYDDKETAKAVLKQAFADNDRTSLQDGQYRSKIIALAFPTKPKNLEQAIADGLKTTDLLLAASGKLAPTKKKDPTTKKVVWAKVEGSGGRQGGHNAKPPIEKAKADAILLFTHIATAKIEADQVAVIIAECIAPATDATDSGLQFTLNDLIAELEKQAQD